MQKYLKLLRIKHYLKNLLIFVPVFFSKNLYQQNIVFNSVLGFLAFSFIASVVYIINDINDIEKDKLHSSKCKRPIASGAVSIKNAYAIALLLVILTIFINGIISNTIASWLCLGTYFILNFFYSKRWKNIAILDIVILSSGFVIRLLYGSTITNILISNWLYLIIIFISFYMGLGKRRNEYEREKDTRKVLKQYNKSFLDKNMYMCLSLTVMFYSLWCIEQKNSSYFLATVPVVMIICMKYSLIIEGDCDGDPVEVIYQNRDLLILILIYVVIMIMLIYGLR